MNPVVSVVVPVYNGEATLPDCLRALAAQSLDKDRYELIVVDDHSTDSSANIADRYAARVVRRSGARGAAAARNAGLEQARGTWVAFTDADCVPSRHWLSSLLAAVHSDADIASGESPVGAAGRTLGYASTSRAARFVDLIGSFDAEHSLAHPAFPWAPSGNVMYRRAALAHVGGFDVRYRSYEACDLHTRVRNLSDGVFLFEPRALVLHRHRSGWRQYWQQQVNYGRGYAQFFLHHRGETRWTLCQDLRAWAHVVRLGFSAIPPGRSDRALVRRGRFVKEIAQRAGFARTYWNPKERSRW